jgi:gas vesicle protein
VKPTNIKSSRRDFFLKGGAAIGASVGGVAAMVNANAATPDLNSTSSDQLELTVLKEREAIRQLQQRFTAAIENQSYQAAAALFHDHAQFELSGANASGKAAIAKLLTEQYRNQTAHTLHSAYRQCASQAQDKITLSNSSKANATFHIEAELCTPLQGNSTLVQMARLQGQMESRHWESGRFEAEYAKDGDQWKITALRYATA